MPRERYLSLDGVRGLAAILVLIAHIIDTVFTPAAMIPHTIADASAKMGMTLFFVLSGCVMYLGYGKMLPWSWHSTVKFFGARFARLYPLYITCFLFYGAASALRDNPVVTGIYLTLSQSWVNVQFRTFPPAWSISTEWFFYIVFFVIFLQMRGWLIGSRAISRVLRMFSKSLHLWCAIVLCCLGIHILLFSNLETLAGQLAFLMNTPKNNISSWLQYASPYVRVLEFIVGIVTGMCVVAHDGRKRDLWIILGMGILVSGMLLLVANATFRQYLLCNFLFAPMLSALIIAATRIHFVMKIFVSQFMVFSGMISYSIYLLQFAVITIVNVLITDGDLVTRLTKGMVIVLFTYCIAYGSYQIIERPCALAIRNLINKISRRRPYKEKSIDVVISTPPVEG